MVNEQKKCPSDKRFKRLKNFIRKVSWTTSSQLPEGYEICPHCEGGKSVLYEKRFRRPCKLCNSTGMVDWVTKAMPPPVSNREFSMRSFEQNEKVSQFRKRMKERIKNDKFKSERRRIR